MTIDGLLTFWALLVAVFAVMSRTQRLNLSLKVRASDIVIAVSAFIAVNFLEFYEPLSKTGWLPDSTCWLFKPNELAYFVVLISVLAIPFSIYISNLPRNKIYRLRDLVEELSTQDQYIEVLGIAEIHLDQLVRIYKTDFPIPKFQRWLESLVLDPHNLENVRQWIIEGDAGRNRADLSPLGKLKIVVVRSVKWFISIFPSNDIDQQIAKEIFRSVLLRPEFIRSVVQNRPYFGLRILALDIYERHDFSDEYFREMITNSKSVLYWEVKNNQNLSGHRYDIPEANRLLWFLFHDARVAEGLGIWQPIGEQMILELERLHRSADDDRYNAPLEDYHERGQWKCPFFVGIRLFDIMVSEAIDQNIQWHMWLYYFPYFTERICRNYHLDSQKVDQDTEFPTPYSLLLYEMISTLRNWIRKVRELPAGQDNAILKGVTLSHENGNPIKSSILALGECLRTILITENVPPRFKRDIGSIVLNLYFEFVRINTLTGYSEVLRNILVVGGLFERHDESSDYLGSIIQAHVSNDNIPHRPDDVAQLTSTLVHRFIEKFGQERLSDYVRVEPWQESSIRISSGRHSFVVEPLGNA